MIRLPNEDDVISRITTLPLMFEITLKGEVFITDMLSRKKYQLLVVPYGDITLMVIEQE